MPLRQTQLRVPEDELEQARKVAAAKGISLSEYLRRALAVQLAYERAVEVQAATTAGWRRAAKRSANGAGATSPTAPNRDATAGWCGSAANEHPSVPKDPPQVARLQGLGYRTNVQ